MAYLAIDALAGLAILALELDQGLRGERVGAVDAGIGELVDDSVALALEALEQGDGLVGEPALAGDLATGAVQGGHGVDVPKLS